MTKKHTRRDILKMSSVYGIGVTGLASAGVVKSSPVTEASQTNHSPQAQSETDLFRLINNSVDSGSTKVRLRHATTGRLVNSFSLDTVGTNHPEMNGHSHTERFPHIAADISSFGDIPAGEYTIEVQFQDLIGKSLVRAGNGGFPSGYKIESYIMPDGRLKVDPVLVTPARPSP